MVKLTMNKKVSTAIFDAITLMSKYEDTDFMRKYAQVPIMVAKR